MPTPVSTARQCLTPEAAHALDEAVSVARRRGHGQTTSLHAVSALLSLPSSILRDACARARNSAYSPRLQFKALELCLSVSLDRVPANQLSPNDPPVSNSLMAAIKRSQANQRRQPENFQLYHQISQQQNSSSISCIKVELQNLILSILDDPVVSRVFGEAGFPSTEIKLAIIRPLPQVLKFSRFRAPPLFLCNLGENPDLGSGRRGFNFPFLGFAGNFSGDENCRRIGEVLARSRARNPLLVGVYAYEALARFSDGIEKRKDKILPMELSGISVISIENEIAEFLRENSDKGYLDLKFERVGKYVEQNIGSGLVLNLGDLKSFGNELSDSVSFVVEKLTKLMQIHGRKIWFIGSTSSYEGYLKVVSRFPSIEKEWDLQLLPITSLRATDSYPRSSLMESFVPFGGFFPTISELNRPSNKSSHFISRCHQCNEKCQQEVAALSKDGYVASVSDQYQSDLPSWLQMTQVGTNKDSDAKTRDDGVVLAAKVAGVHKKWDSICRRLHPAQISGSNAGSPQFPALASFHLAGDEKHDTEKHCSNTTIASPDVSNPMNEPFNIPKKLLGVPLMDKIPSKEDRSSSNSSPMDSNQESPVTVTLVTTDLGLTISPAPTCDNPKNSLSCGLSSSSSSSLDFREQFDSAIFKKIYRALSEVMSWQDEAVQIISQTIADKRDVRCKRGIWFNFRGPDRCGIKKIVVALAELVCGSKENLISADLSPENFLTRSQGQYLPGYDVMFRGKTIVDYVGGELYKKPLSVVFLENVDKAEAPAQHCLSHAIKTGRFLYSNGREVGISNAIFVTTSEITGDERTILGTFSEEKILKVKGCPMRLLLEQTLTDKWGQSLNLSVCSRDNMFVNKRKQVGIDQDREKLQITEVVKRAHTTSPRDLDLNLPAEDNVQDGISSDKDKVLGNSNTWLRDFLDRVDGTVVFKPFDFGTLADRVLNDINESFRKIIGSKCAIEVDPKVLEQLLAAGYLSGREKVAKWVEEVLSRGFVDFSKRYNLKADSIVNLVLCEGVLFEEQEAGGYLPSKILF